MPLKRGKDSRGSYYQWGNSRKKYYYNGEEDRKRAKQKAIIQGYAIEKSEERRGKKSDLRRSKSTGRKTRLEGVGKSKKKSSGSKSSSSRIVRRAMI